MYTLLYFLYPVGKGNWLIYKKQDADTLDVYAGIHFFEPEHWDRYPETIV
jgi:hypothetical protein